MALLKYVLKRIIVMIPTLLVVSAFTFFIIRVSPSDPINSITGGKKISQETREQLREQFGLNKSLPAQYLAWLEGLFKGDFGTSFQHRQPVTLLLSQRFPTTLQLVAMAVVLALILSLPIGIISAVKKDGLVDRLLSGISVLFVSAPSFLIALVLMLIFSLRLRIFPAMGAARSFGANLYFLFLPALALSLNMVALFARILRSSLIGELSSQYTVTERAKGTKKWDIVFKHCLRGSIIPVLTVGGVEIGSMVTGAVLVENVFALGGIGDLLISGIKAADYPVVQSVVFILVAMFLVINLIVDILYAIIDPRILADMQSGGGK